MTERERLIELLQKSRKYLNERDCDECRGHADCSICTDRDTADYLLENGVVVLARDGNNFNTDLYCPYCGNNLSSTKALNQEAEPTLFISKEEAEQSLLKI